MINETELLQEMFRNNRWGADPEFIVPTTTAEERQWEVIPTDSALEARLLAITERHRQLTKIEILDE